MSRVPLIAGKEAVRRMQKIGFVFVRQHGSHVRLSKHTPFETIHISIPLHPELKKGTLLRIIKDAGLSVEEFNLLK